ncbi:probable G-protein coupled receptor Mth-like 1 [Cephus cinctus]|uniref:Probable G-protein coupled receptor Mth-like 1 n=1 Tax=Cephus cinctus TaxID=211228 RepID=A0AAJ7FJQ8_CEPCN|nr:probable G-protein coupled receptor Mth-like 1 [Cephus cinctus]
MKLTIGLVLLTVLALVLSEPNNTKTKVRVLKCCRDDQELRESDEPGIVAKCVMSQGPWLPLIYSRRHQKLLPSIPNEWEVIEDTKPRCPDNTVLTFVPDAPNPFFLTEEGHALLSVESNESVKAGEYCADSKALLVCAKRTENHAAATKKPQVHRCCGKNAIFEENERICALLNDDPDAPPLLSNASMVDIVPGFPPCPNSDKYDIVGKVEDAVLLPNGGLEVDGIQLPTGQFCIERIMETKIAKVFACSEHNPQRSVVQKADIRFTLYPLAFIISVIFLAATLGTGWLLPASHHVLHWRCQTHHIACLMLGDLVMAIIQLASGSIKGPSCKALAIMAHFFFLAAFFWLNTMCFNIWWSFRDLRSAMLEKGPMTLRLRVYACYAWGGPLLVAGLAALLDYLPPQPEYNFLRPRFGEKQCWFYGDMEILVYFFVPVGILLAVNLVFFAATAWELTCGLWKGEFVKSNTERAALGRVCMKLVIVMGVTWVTDVVSWAVGGPQYLWYFTDLVNASQGVFIFIVVGCQPQVRAAVKRLCSKNPRSNAGRQGNALSTTSHGMPSMGDSVTQNPSTKTAPLETIC